MDVFAAGGGRGVGAAIDGKTLGGKTLRGSQKAADGSGALHLPPASACEAGLVTGQRAVDGKSKEIKALPELLEMLAVTGAIVAIAAMGTPKAIAAKITEKAAGYVLALKGHRSTLHDDVKRFLGDAELAKTCAVHKTTDAGHGRIEERECRARDAIDGLKRAASRLAKLARHRRHHGKPHRQETGQTSGETRFCITSLPAGPAAIRAAARGGSITISTGGWI